MPRRTDIKKILLIGSGPIVIGQACEFDYSGTQACKALREEGYQVVLINSNPATIMTDPEFAHRTYIEPILPEVVEKIIDRERPDALLPTMGGQTSLNVAVALDEGGVLDRYGVELIGAKADSIRRAENRQEFKKAMQKIQCALPESGYAKSREEAVQIIERIGFPVIIRPSFTLGGSGGNIASQWEEVEEALEWGFQASPVHELLIEESVIGWKEFELEVMRDLKDNVVVVCSIENIDPMGIHTGDSITVAPAQTLTDKEYQGMRNAACAIIREIGVECGGANIQFAVRPEDGKRVVIEMNPRVSRSSALASKATGFPIAKIAAKLSVGYTLDEIMNDITRVTPSCFEPTIDYVVIKFPRFAFEKFPGVDSHLTTQMKSVGEAMAIGRTFKEAFQKGMRSLEIEAPPSRVWERGELLAALRIPSWERPWQIMDAFRMGIGVEEIYAATRIDPWFLSQLGEMVEMEREMRRDGVTPSLLCRAKGFGFSDLQIARLLNVSEEAVASVRKREGVFPVFKRVDTCGAEFEANTPYLYSAYERECESRPTSRKKVIILGSGPNRIGQGIEFDYCCVHAVFAVKEEGYEAIMVNCNPETVSTDYDTADRLYFEPLTYEDVLHIVEREKPMGVVVQFGGQTPLKLVLPLEKAGVPILGTSPDSIDRAEDRERFRDLLCALGLRQPESSTARSLSEAVESARRVTYPVIVRPSYVLGGRAMEIVFDEKGLREFMSHAVAASPGRPVLIEKYLEDAAEIDVDALSDGETVVIGGIMEHIEEAGVHSGDSACSLPPYSLSPEILREITVQTEALARELHVVGLMNVQYAVKDGSVYCLEVNPRASRTVPFVSKAIGLPLAKIAMKVMLGRRLTEFGGAFGRKMTHVAVKEAVFPFTKLPGVDTILGPEMKSTGEVMGIDEDVGQAFAKAQAGAGNLLPRGGVVFISVKDKDKPLVLSVARSLLEMGFSLLATRGTAQYLCERGLPVEMINKVKEGRPHIIDRIRGGGVSLVINTVGDRESQADSYSIRRTVIMMGVPYFTTIAGARMAVRGIEAQRKSGLRVRSLQEYHSPREKRGCA